MNDLWAEFEVTCDTCDIDQFFETETEAIAYAHAHEAVCK